MTAPNYPSWDRAADYLAEAQAGMAQVAEDTGAGNTNVWQSIDKTIAALHKLRSAAGSEQRRRHDEMVARMEAEDAARRARPALPSPDVVAEVQKCARLGYPAMARLELQNNTSMSLAAATEFVEDLVAREGVAR